MSAEKLVRSLSAEALARVLSANIEAVGLTTASAISAEAKIQVIVTIAPWEPATLQLNAAGREAFPELAPPREIERTILEACPTEPVTLKRLASLSGYSYNQYFREAVEGLVQRRLLSRCARGVARLPS